MSNRMSVLLTGALLSIAASCSDIEFTEQGYKKVVLSGLETIPEARQFDEVFGKENVDTAGPASWRRPCASAAPW